MAKVSMELIQKLRNATGLGMMDCKKALVESEGDLDKAIEALRKKGAAMAAKRSDKDTTEGLVHAYIHPGSQVGVLLELNCETDFVARNENLANFAKDVCMHIAAFNPPFLAPEDVSAEFLEKEKAIMKEQMKESGKPENIIDKIVEGKTDKLYSEVCLLNQPFIKNDKISVEDALKELIAKTGENVKIKKFARFEVGC